VVPGSAVRLQSPAHSAERYNVSKSRRGEAGNMMYASHATETRRVDDSGEVVEKRQVAKKCSACALLKWPNIARCRFEPERRKAQ